MSTRRNITVTRTYTHDADACLRALTLLLKNPVCKEGGPHTAPKDDIKELSEYVARTNCNAS